MRIFSIITSFTSGGAETLVTNLSRGFARVGHAPVVAALCDAETLGNSAAFEQTLRSKISESGGEAHSLGLSARRDPLSGMAALRRLIRAVQPDVIHTHTARALPMLWLARPAAPVVLTHHNTRFSFPLPLFHLFDRVVGEYVAISEECARLIRPHTSRRITAIRNAVGEDYFTDTPRSLAGDPVQIISVGALSAQKDYPTLIRAAQPLRKRLAERGQRAQFRIAGGGAMLHDLQSLVNAEGVSDMVELLGTRTDIGDLLLQADLFVNSSLYEGLPIAILEAMATGLPVIATQVAGNVDIINDGVNGLLAQGGCPQALAAAIDQSLSDPALYAALSRGAIATARGHSIEAYVDSHLRVYERLRGVAHTEAVSPTGPTGLSAYP